jgi:hypothetical protein
MFWVLLRIYEFYNWYGTPVLPYIFLREIGKQISQ